MPKYIATVEKVTEYYLEFLIEEVNSWTLQDQPLDIEQLLICTYKWDNCADIEFMGAARLHFCGERDFALLGKLIEKIPEIAKLFRTAEAK